MRGKSVSYNKKSSARGRKGGRLNIKQENVTKALKLYDTRKVAIPDICTMCNLVRTRFIITLGKERLTSDNVPI